MVCDVADREAVERAAASVRERHPAVKLLVNNAGIPGRETFLALEPERIEQVVRVNYLGGVWCLRAFLPQLDAARPSHVVNVVSIAGAVAVPFAGPYCAAKHAQLAFSRATAAELRARGIHVHALNPGLVETDGFPNRHRFPRPLDRIVISPERVAERVAGLASGGQVESYVPGWYRAGTIVQALVPGLVARALGRTARRRAGGAPSRGASVR